ncbi:MAG: hypothetical protein ACFHWX_05595 [Bacteroidota bacterium]
MKKLSFCFILLLAVQGVSAQSKTYIGVKGGGNFSSAYFERTIGNALITTDYLTSYHTGLIFRHFSRQKQSSFLNAGLQSGVNLVNKGWKQTFPTDEPPYATRLTYLEFPAEALIYFGHKKTKPFFSLGFYLEHLINVEKGQNPNLSNIGQTDFYPYEESRDRTFGYGIRIGLGIFRDFKFGTFQLDGFASYGFRDILNYGSFDTGIPDLSNTYVLGFSVAYLISFGELEF